MALVVGRGLGRLSTKPGGSSNLEDKVLGGEERSHGDEGVPRRGELGTPCRSVESLEGVPGGRMRYFTLCYSRLLFPLFLVHVSGLLPLVKSSIYSPIAVLAETKSHQECCV